MKRFSIKNPFQFFFFSDRPSRPTSPPQHLDNGTVMPQTKDSDNLAAPPLSSPTESAIDSTFSAPPTGAGTPDSGVSASYFPNVSASHKHLSPHECCTCVHRSPSMSSSISSDASSSTSDLNLSRPTILRASTTSNLTPLPTPAPVPGRVKHTTDPLSRQFPKPDQEPTLDELLARKPGKWTLGHYVKNARDVGLQTQQPVNTEARRRELEEAKRKLLDLAGR